MPWTIHIRLLTGAAVAVRASPETSLEDLRQAARKEMKADWAVQLVTAQGEKLTGKTSLAAVGLKDGDEITAFLPDAVRVKAHKFGRGFAAIMPDGSVDVWGQQGYFHLFKKQKKEFQDVVDISLTETAVAAIRSDGTVVTCGDDFGGGDVTTRDMNDVHLVSMVLDKQKGLHDIVSIEANSSAFAALRGDGRVFAWGNPSSGGGLESDRLEDELTSVVKIFSNKDAFAALRVDGGLVCWGDAASGGGARVQNVEDVVSTARAFAARRRGGVFTWGDPDYGADSSGVQEKLQGVRRVYGNKFAFAAVKEDGNVVAWGPAEYGGDCSSVQDKLVGVQHIEPSRAAFAAITLQTSVDASKGVKVQLSSGVVSWGDAMHGGDSSGVQDKLMDVVQIKSTKGAFAALRSDGLVVAWGCQIYGGDASRVQAQLVDVQELYASQSSFAALRADGQVITWGHQDDNCDDPELEKQLVNVSYVAASKLALAAVTTKGDIVTWGDPDHGGRRPEPS